MYLLEDYVKSLNTYEIDVIGLNEEYLKYSAQREKTREFKRQSALYLVAFKKVKKYFAEVVEDTKQRDNTFVCPDDMFEKENLLAMPQFSDLLNQLLKEMGLEMVYQLENDKYNNFSVPDPDGRLPKPIPFPGGEENNEAARAFVGKGRSRRAKHPLEDVLAEPSNEGSETGKNEENPGDQTQKRSRRD
jgi:hypothetical protein